MTCKRRGPRGCQCECTFAAGFAYDSDGCILKFSAGNIVIDNVSRDPSTVDITVEIEGPDGPEDGVQYLTGLLYWEKWQPVADSVYTATVTLVCTEKTVTRTYSFTIPNPANSGCDCCTLRNLESVTVSGLVSDFAAFNGTYAVVSKSNPSGLIGASCDYMTVQGELPGDLPENPCGEFPDPEATVGAPVSADAIYQCRFTLTLTPTGFYYYAGSIRIGGWTTAGTGPGYSQVIIHTSGKVRVRVYVYYRVWRWRLVGSTATCEAFGEDGMYWDYEADCEGGPMELVATNFGVRRCNGSNEGDGPATPFEDPPTVELFFE